MQEPPNRRNRSTSGSGEAEGNNPQLLILRLVRDHRGQPTRAHRLGEQAKQAFCSLYTPQEKDASPSEAEVMMTSLLNLQDCKS
jgi:hypothetical protein